MNWWDNPNYDSRGTQIPRGYFTDLRKEEKRIEKWEAEGKEDEECS